ncbi:hypothetical protein [Noviherbaspirillum saxi]|nr:hypothetical protein [Noviherbaspirillum saxi]
MPFVYSLAGNLMRTYSSGSSGDWLSDRNVFKEQFNVLQNTYGVTEAFDVRRRLGF